MNIFSIDVEDFLHAEYLRKYRDELIIPENNNLTEISEMLIKNKLKATFFVVGEYLEAFPEVFKHIEKQGHEIAFHTYDHRPLWEKNERILDDEIRKFDELLASYSMEKCIGFRSPSFSLNQETSWLFKVIRNNGYRYDSSLFPFRTPLYGVSNANLVPYKPKIDDFLVHDDAGDITEFPLTVYSYKGIKIPISGGFYLRALPLFLIKNLLARVNEKGYPGIMYVHSWELDDVEYKILDPFKFFITYYNIKNTKERLLDLKDGFTFTSFKEYIKSNEELT